MSSCLANRPRSAACGEPASGRSRADDVLGPQDEPGGGAGRGHGGRRRQLGGEDGGGRDLLLAQAPLPAPLHQGDAQRPHGRPAVGRHRADHGQRDDADDDGGGPDDGGPADSSAARPQGRGERGERDPAGPDAGRDEERPAETGQLDQRATGLAQEHAAEREPAEGPRHADALGQGARADEGQGTPAPRRRGAGGSGEEERLDEDEHDGAVPVEGTGPEEADGVAAQAGQPAGPETGPQPQTGQAPVEQGGTREPQGPPAPGWEREREEDTRRDRGGGDAAPARRAAHKSACAAARPLAMQAGMPTPWYAAPATATPPRRASADSTPAVRSRWCTRYCGKASVEARHPRRSGLTAHAHERAQLLPGPLGDLLVAPPGGARVVDAPERGAQQHLAVACRGAATCDPGRCTPSPPTARVPCAGCGAARGTRCRATSRGCRRRRRGRSRARRRRSRWRPAVPPPRRHAGGASAAVAGRRRGQHHGVRLDGPARARRRSTPTVDDRSRRSAGDERRTSAPRARRPAASASTSDAMPPSSDQKSGGPSGSGAGHLGTQRPHEAAAALGGRQQRREGGGGGHVVDRAGVDPADQRVDQRVDDALAELARHERADGAVADRPPDVGPGQHGVTGEAQRAADADDAGAGRRPEPGRDAEGVALGQRAQAPAGPHRRTPGRNGHERRRRSPPRRTGRPPRAGGRGTRRGPGRRRVPRCPRSARVRRDAATPPGG